MRTLLILTLAGLFLCKSESRVAAPDKVDWRPWSQAVFADAKRDHKFVLLDLQATWCHWCHVMDKETYSDPKVIALINARYIAVRVDQDAQPDLSNRYEDYGWPATVVFAADGSEIVKRQGYIPPRPMASMLQAIIDDPSPGPSVKSSVENSRAADTRALQKRMVDAFDTKLGGWGGGHKFLDWDNLEYLITRGAAGDAQSAAMARQTLAGAMKLIDPVWGGADQYSIGDWDHPHFEKLIQMQAQDMRIYALAYAAFHDPVYLEAAKKIHGYVARFLTSADGTVYVSQDADLVDGEAPEPYYKLDDAGRRKLGVPRVDRHVYARENGWWIEALCQLYAVTGDESFREEAVRDANWIVRFRGVSGGGFRHGGEEGGPLFLGDTLWMGRAFSALAQVTGGHDWYQRSEQAAAFIRAHFAAADGKGFVTATRSAADGSFQPRPEYDENVALARWANLLAHDLRNKDDQAMAASALGYTRDGASARFAYVGGYLLAQAEAKADPLHIVVIGPRNDGAARALFLAALAAPAYYKQIEWFDPARPVPDLYPKLAKPAVFLCANRACSAPVYTAADLARLIERKSR